MKENVRLQKREKKYLVELTENGRAIAQREANDEAKKTLIHTMNLARVT